MQCYLLHFILLYSVFHIVLCRKKQTSLNITFFVFCVRSHWSCSDIWRKFMEVVFLSVSACWLKLVVLSIFSAINLNWQTTWHYLQDQIWALFRFKVNLLMKLCSFSENTSRVMISIWEPVVNGAKKQTRASSKQYFNWLHFFPFSDCWISPALVTACSHKTGIWQWSVCITTFYGQK
jgi:hypothetical protein